MSDTFGVGVVGSSGHAARIAAPVIDASAEARLVGVLGSAPGGGAALAASYDGCRGYDGLTALLDDDAVDAVWICAPNHLHAELASECLAAGRHVLLEKPMATRAADADALARAAAAPGAGQLRVGYHHRFRAGHRWLAERIAEGRFGDLATIRVHRCWRFPYYPDMDEGAVLRSWRMSPERSGGWVLSDLGSHLLDCVIDLAGEAVALRHARTVNARFDVAVEDTAALMLDIGDRGIGLVQCSNAVDSFPSVIEVHGTGGWARAQGTFEDGGEIVCDDGERLSFAGESPADAYARQLADFVAVARGGPPGAGADAAAGARNVAILEGAVRSGR